MTRRPGDSKFGVVFRIGRSRFFSAWCWDATAGRALRRSTGCTLRDTAIAVARRWHREYENAVAGIDTPERRESEKPIAKHIDEFVEARRVSPGAPTADHLALLKSRLLRVTKKAGWSRIADIGEHGFSAALECLSNEPDYRRRGKPSKGVKRLSPQTRNHFRAAYKSFTNWLYRTHRLLGDPLLNIAKWKTEGFQTFQRRALTTEEFAALERSTEASARRFGISGVDRAALYRLAVCTGFRRGELASLTPRAFAFGDQPAVALGAEFSKNRKPWTQPLERETGDLLHRWLAGRDRSALLWPGLNDVNTAAMLVADLDAAGVAAIDDDGTLVDFHALRHTFCSWLALRGVSETLVQRLARHSSSTLTDRFYVHVGLEDLRGAVDQLRLAGAGQPQTGGF